MNNNNNKKNKRYNNNNNINSSNNYNNNNKNNIITIKAITVPPSSRSWTPSRQSPSSGAGRNRSWSDASDSGKVMIDRTTINSTQRGRTRSNINNPNNPEDDQNSFDAVVNEAERTGLLSITPHLNFAARNSD
jgi:hypothetical protein